MEKNLKRHYVWILLGLILLLCLSIRIFLPWNIVFTDSGVRILEVDPYYHLRAVDWLLHNDTLKPPQTDPYLSYPAITPMGKNNLLPIMIAQISKLFSSNPSDELVKTVASFIPPILAMLTTLVIFFVGKTFLGDKLGLLAASIYTIIPGESMRRSLFGFVDQHILEVLLSSIVILLFILPLKYRDKLMTSLCLSIFSGIFLWLYFWAWAGALLIPFIICLYIIGQSIYDHTKKTPQEYLLATGTLLFGTCSILLLSNPIFTIPLSLSPIIIITATSIPMFMYLISQLTINKHKAYYFTSIISLVVIVVIVVYALGYFTIAKEQIANSLSIFVPITNSYTSEELSIFFSNGDFTLSNIWVTFGACSIISLAGLVLVINRIKNDDKLSLLLVIWSIITLVLTLALKRFSYYSAVTVSILTPITILVLWDFTIKLTTDIWRKVSLVILVLVIIVLPFVPQFSSMSKLQSTDMTNDWQETLAWLKANTPEPFGDANYYYAGYNSKPPLTPSYTVLTWWDYGYWITKETHRVPIANPGGGARIQTAKYLTSTDKQEIDTLSQKLKPKYIVIDNQMITNKFPAILSLSERQIDNLNYDDMLAQKLYSGKKVDGFKLVFQSSGRDKVKVFEKLP